MTKNQRAGTAIPAKKNPQRMIPMRIPGRKMSRKAGIRMRMKKLSLPMTMMAWKPAKPLKLKNPTNKKANNSPTGLRYSPSRLRGCFHIYLHFSEGA